MRILSGKREVGAFLQKLNARGRGVSPSVLKDTEKIISSVRRFGDVALRRYTKKFDGHETLRITPAKIKAHARRASARVVSDLKLSAGRIRKFHRHQIERSWSVTEDGARLGQVIRPLRRVGVYVPGGRASYPSTVLMNVIPAQVAGVKEIAVAVPTPGGQVDPNVMAAIEMLGVQEVYCIGGAQAVAALAYGTRTVGRVDKIAGPGNVYVATAKRLVFGQVDIDMIAGPSEVLIIADATARPEFIAADLLSQAEHDPMASSVLLTVSAKLAATVSDEMERQLSRLGRKKIAADSIRRYGAAIVVKSIKEAAALANSIAPEHLEIMTREPRKVLPMIHNAGAIFLGHWSPEPIGDYSAGPNHTLPTGGTARWSSPLGVYDFIKRSSLIEFTEKGFSKLAGPVSRLAMAEGLDAHAETIHVRSRK